VCVATSVCAVHVSQQQRQRRHDSPTGTPTPPSTLDFRTSEGGGRGLFRLYLRRYGSVGAETACASLRVCAPCRNHSSTASAALTRPPARPHHPPRSISGPQKGGERVRFAAISAATAPLELKLRVCRYECVRRALITAAAPARHASPAGTPTPPSTLDLRTSEGGGRGLFRLYLRRYGCVGAETACASLRVCAPCTNHSRPASAGLTLPPARPHHPPRSISGPQKGGERVCFGCTSAAIPPLELKLRVRRYECVRRPLSTAAAPAPR